eukprot:GILI01019833.1.p1 GENE.GILI01019833.1~~GILI01019833.1.p1  ORF type:complete len:355 (-),score=37.25 GILI01019833.1:44-1108(-)
MAKKPVFTLALDEDIVDEVTPSYTINPADSELILRAFVFQAHGKLFSTDGRNLSSITNDEIDWGNRDVVGHGASGKVYHAKLKATGEPIAVKCIPIATKAHRDEVERELQFLTSKYDSSYVVANYGAFWDPVEHMISIPMEWMAYSLADLVKFNQGLPEDCARDIIFQLLRALAYLHDVKKVIHRDIKPGNILLSPRGEVKIGDFGVSKMVQTLNISSTYVGTMLYMAPERIDEGGNYSFSSDVWSLGLTFIASATGRSPWGSDNGNEVKLFQLMQKLSSDEVPELPEKYSPNARAFVGECLRRDPDVRPTCKELLKHPFFESCTLESTKENINMLMVQTTRLVQQAAKSAIGV